MGIGLDIVSPVGVASPTGHDNSVTRSFLTAIFERGMTQLAASTTAMCQQQDEILAEWQTRYGSKDAILDAAAGGCVQ